MTAFFVTATGTDIGKTFVTTGLIRYLRSQGKPVAALKPVVSGFDPAHADESDPAVLLAALGRKTDLSEIAMIAPWRFRAPLSPEMAARKEGRALEFDALIEFCRKAMAAHLIEGIGGTLFIEGIGGVMVPLDEKRTVLDWIETLGRPVILVAGSYLGTLSHTLTAFEVLARRQAKIAAVVVSETPESAVPLDDTVATIARFANPLPVVALPYRKSAGADHPAFAEIAALL